MSWVPNMPTDTNCWPLDETMAIPEGMLTWMGTCDISRRVRTLGYVWSPSEVEWGTCEGVEFLVRIWLFGTSIYSEGTALPFSYRTQMLCPPPGLSLKETHTQGHGIAFTGPVPSTPQCTAFWLRWVEAQALALEWSRISLTLILPLATADSRCAKETDPQLSSEKKGRESNVAAPALRPWQLGMGSACRLASCQGEEHGHVLPAWVSPRSAQW